MTKIQFNKLVRLTLLAEIDRIHAPYPQYKNYFDEWRLALTVSKQESKTGTMPAGTLTLVKVELGTFGVRIVYVNPQGHCCSAGLGCRGDFAILEDEAEPVQPVAPDKITPRSVHEEFFPDLVKELPTPGQMRAYQMKTGVFSGQKPAINIGDWVVLRADSYGYWRLYSGPHPSELNACTRIPPGYLYGVVIPKAKTPDPYPGCAPVGDRVCPHGVKEGAPCGHCHVLNPLPGELDQE